MLQLAYGQFKTATDNKYEIILNVQTFLCGSLLNSKVQQLFTRYLHVLSITVHPQKIMQEDTSRLHASASAV